MSQNKAMPMHGPRHGHGGPKASLKDMDFSLLGRIFKYLGKYKIHYFFVLVCIIVTALVQVSGTKFMQTMIDLYLIPLMGQQNPDVSGFVSAILKMGFIYLIGAASSTIYQQLMVSISQGTLRKIRMDLFEKMEKLPISFFDTHTHGEVMSYYTNDVDTLQQLISQSIPQLFQQGITVVTVFVAMVTTSWQLTIFVVIFVALIMIMGSRITANSGKYFMLQQQKVADVNGYVEEMMHGQKVVKVFTYEDRSKHEFDQKNEELFKVSSKANAFSNMLMPMVGNLGNLEYILIAILGGYIMIAHPTAGLTTGGIAAFLQLSKNFTMPIQQISMQANSIIMAMAGAKRIFDLMDQPEENDDGYVTLVNAKYVNGQLQECDEETCIWAWKHPHHDGTLTYTQVKGEVRFYDVDFSYKPEKQILYDISLYAKPGQKVAFVGATGAGKTTITNLINRFYDIQDGKIRYDGINIRKIKKSDLRRSLGMVLQDVNLFTGTIMDNIRYGKLDATDEECIAAAKLANAHEFIQRLPHGYQTEIKGDGSSLSQGQKQLLSIARTAVANPPVMILDEATSSIDTRTEKKVQDGMDALMAGRTTFVIAHRLSTVQNADVIMVMENGHIIERGNHEQLIAQHGKYYQLYTGGLELE